MPPAPQRAGEGSPTLGEILRASAMRTPDRVALTFEGRDTDYRAMLATCTRSAQLLGADARVGDRVGILSRNSDTMICVLLGATMAGLVSVPVNWRLTAVEMRALLADAQLCTLVVEDALRDLAQQALAGLQPAPALMSIRAFEPDSTLAAAPVASPIPDARSGDEVALQLYTSGTSGRPKGVRLSHHSLNCVRLAQPASAGWSQWSPEDVCLVSMPLFHIGGIGNVLAALRYGARIVIAREFSPEIVFEAIAEERVTRMFAVPTALRMILDDPRSRVADFTSLRYVFYGSMPITQELLSEARAAFGCDFVQVYGMTETSGTIAALTPDDHQRGGALLRAAGKPLAGVEIRIGGTGGSPLPAGEVGEICVRSEAVMAGYWNLPEETRTALSPDGFLHTGDAGYLDEQGYLYVCDRLKDMIITGGENVYAAEVEAALLLDANVVEAAVVGQPDEKWGERVAAVIVVPEEGAFSGEQLIEAVRQRLAPFKIPRIIVSVAAIPRNAAGKIVRRSIREGMLDGSLIALDRYSR